MMSEMPYAVLDLDLAKLPEDLPEAGRYEAALVLLRIDGRPCGQAILDLRRSDGTSLRSRLLEGADSAFWESWLRQELGLGSDVPAAPPAPAATVAICTRDRTPDLGHCLTALLAMPDDGQEILVVDNAPASDATLRLVDSMPRVRYVREDRPGLDVARNRSLREAAHPIVAFIDDDAAPDPLWLRTLLRNFSDPLVLASTGLTMAMELETEAQVTFQRLGGFARGFKRIIHDAASLDPFLAWHAGAGVNMAVRKEVLGLVGSFDEALDAGTLSRAGGDSDLFRRILASGYRIAYDPEALNWHRHRRSMAELEQQLFGYEAAAFAILTKAFLFEGNWGAGLRAVRWACRQARDLPRAALRRPGAAGARIQLAQLRGGLAGPFLYLRARRRSRNDR
jgi:glycosyltransferase involved in cell wall biosynthesis